MQFSYKDTYLRQHIKQEEGNQHLEDIQLCQLVIATISSADIYPTHHNLFTIGEHWWYQ